MSTFFSSQRQVLFFARQRVRFSSRRRFSTVDVALPASKRRWGVYAGAGLAGLGLGQLIFGSPKPYFFKYSFTTDKVSDANELAEFYGNEDFMQIFCVLPIMEMILMRGATFDDEGVVHTWGMPFGSMTAQMTFSEKEADLSGDGEDDTVVAFQKQESFVNYLPFGLGRLFSINLLFGYERNEDGTVTITHTVKDFEGFWLYRLIFQAQARYVIWATERYVNSEEFSSDDMEGKEHFRKLVVPHEAMHLLHTLEHDIGTKLSQFKRQRAYQLSSGQFFSSAGGQVISAELIAELEALHKQLRTINLQDTSVVNELEVHIKVPGSSDESEVFHLVIKDDQARELIQKSMQLLQPGITKQKQDGRVAASFRRSVEKEKEYLEKQSLRIMGELEHVVGGAASTNTYASQAPVGSTWSTLMANIQRRKKAVYEVIAPHHGEAFFQTKTKF